MSDQGERGVRWTEMSESTAEHETGGPATGPMPQVGEDPDAAAGVPFSEAKVPEVRMPAPTGRTDFSDSDLGGPPLHDVWGKVEAADTSAAVPSGETGTAPEALAEPAPVLPDPDPDPESGGEPRDSVADLGADLGGGFPDPGVPDAELPDAEDVKVAPVIESRPSFEPQSALDAQLPLEARPPLEAPSGFDSQPSFAPADPSFAPAQQSPVDTEPSFEAPDSAPARPPAPAGEPAGEGDPAAGNGPGWEGTLFDGAAGADDKGETDPRYVPADASGAAGPASGKSGKPSSGNWQMPDWMADENSADGLLGRSGDPDDDEGGRSRLILVGGVGLLVLALLAAGGVYVMKGNKDGGGSGEVPPQRTAGAQQQARQEAQDTQAQLPPDKPLKQFAGTPSRALGQVADPHSGLSFPRLARPWMVPTKANKLGTPGWSGQQILLTEKRGDQLWYGQLLTGTLLPSLQSAYQGPQSVKSVSGLAAKGFEANYYGFPHKTAPLASQSLEVSGHKGWLVASYLTYKRAGVKATGEVVVTAVIDNGRPAPAVVFASIPNTHRKLWPDLNRFIANLKVTTAR